MAEPKTHAKPTMMVKVTKDPAPGEETVLLKRTTPTLAPTHLNTILIAVSDSKHSEYAFNWVLNNVLREENIAKTKVVLLTMRSVVDQPYHFEPPLCYETDSYLNYYRALLRHFDMVLLKKFPHANVELQLGDGATGEGIVTYAETHNVDAVYLGSRGLGVMKRVFLGSVGHYCAHHLKFPVMIIKHP
jgi:nucleotide-binding universal stress UspA family protein